MRILFLLLLLTVSVRSGAQTKNPFLTLGFDKVVFYDFKESGEKGTMIADNNGKYLQTILKQVRLNTVIIKRLNAKLGDKSLMEKALRPVLVRIVVLFIF